jgi:ankyrin repeat protein
VVKLLLDKGVPVNAVTSKGENTALHLAARLNAGADIVKLLIGRGADIGMKSANRGGTTAHDEAVEFAFFDVGFRKGPIPFQET